MKGGHQVAMRAQMARYQLGQKGKGGERRLVFRLAIGEQIQAATGWHAGDMLAVEKYPGDSLFYRVRPTCDPLRGARLQHYGRPPWLHVLFKPIRGMPKAKRKSSECFWTIGIGVTDEISFTLPAWSASGPKRWRVAADYFQDEPQATMAHAVVRHSRAGGLVRYGQSHGAR